MNREKIFIFYLLTVSLLGMLFVVIVTHQYGAGLSTDGARYISTAENLIKGKGFYDYLNAPLTQFPPLYPLLIAGVSFTTGMDVFIAAQYFNILIFGLLIWLAGSFFRKLFPNEILFAYIGSAVFVTSISLIRIASNVLSDLPFLALTVLFLIVATNFLNSNSQKSLFFLSLLSTVLPLQRYAGLVFILTGMVIVFIKNQGEWVKGLFSAIKFGLLTSFPIMAWITFHNYLRTGILFGVHRPPSIAGNLHLLIEKSIHWFVPYSATARIPEWLILVLIIIILATGNHPVDWERWAKKLSSSSFLPSLTFLVFYGGVLVFMVSYTEIRWPFLDRIHIIILPPLMAIGFMTIKKLKPFYLRPISTKALHTATIIVFIIWLMYPLNNIQKYLRSAYYDGEISEYNLYNTRAQNESGLREFITSLHLTSKDKVYSNYEPIAWLYSRQTIMKLPQGPAIPEAPNPDTVLKNYPNWPGNNGAGYVIWMKELGFKEYVLSPDQLTVKADFELLFSSKQGDVYRITPK